MSTTPASCRTYTHQPLPHQAYETASSASPGAASIQYRGLLTVPQSVRTLTTTHPFLRDAQQPRPNGGWTSDRSMPAKPRIGTLRRPELPRGGRLRSSDFAAGSGASR